MSISFCVEQTNDDAQAIACLSARERPWRGIMRLATTAWATAGLMKVALWLLAVATLELGVMVWMLPPRKIEGRLPQAEHPKMPLELKRYTVCGFAGPCWEVVGVPISR